MSFDRKHPITFRQIRAARSLLDWSQEDLAEAADLSIATIRKIEAGHISPRDKTMDAIVTALENSRVEFIASGVRLKTSDTYMLEGDDCYMQLLEDIHHATKDKKDEVLFIYADNTLITEEEIQSVTRTKINGVKFRWLADEANSFFHHPLDEFRLLPKKFFKRNIQVIYGTKIAMGIHVDKTRNLTTKILVVDSAPLAAATKNLFEFIWENCRKPAFSTTPIFHKY